MLRILIAVKEMPGMLPKVREVSGKISSGKSDHKLFIVSCIFASVRVFSSIQLILYVNYAFIVMKSLCRILIIDSSTTTSMIRVPINMDRSAARHQGISQFLDSGNLVSD